MNGFHVTHTLSRGIPWYKTDSAQSPEINSWNSTSNWSTYKKNTFCTWTILNAIDVKISLNFMFINRVNTLKNSGLRMLLNISCAFYYSDIGLFQKDSLISSLQIRLKGGRTKLVKKTIRSIFIYLEEIFSNVPFIILFSFLTQDNAVWTHWDTHLICSPVLLGS
jgi:hypothetical protein